MNISLRGFLEMGALGDLRVGLPVEQVRALLGPPNDTGGTSHKYPRPTIYVYGSVELFFTQKKPIICHAITWYAHRGEFRLTAHDTVRDWGLWPGMRLAQVEDYLNAERLVFMRPVEPFPDAGTILALPSGITIVFDEAAVLYSISFY